MRTIVEYKELFSQMRVNGSGDKKAPHKAILLLSVIDLIERGFITTPFVPLSHELSQTFNRLWKELVPSSYPFSRRISYPFFHLNSSPFWNLVKTDSYVGQKEYSSLSTLKRDYSGAVIDDDLFRYLSDPTTASELKDFLKVLYLPRLEENAATKDFNSPLIDLLAILTLICSVA